MVTWENFKKKMFKKNKIFERDFKEIERRIKMRLREETIFVTLNNAVKDLSDPNNAIYKKKEIINEINNLTKEYEKILCCDEGIASKKVDVIDYLTEKQEN